MGQSEAQADIAVIGAGAAGLMAAVSAARFATSSCESALQPRRVGAGAASVAQSNKSLRIFLFDSKVKIGAKILMSGGTRCNVTNKRVLPQDYEGGPKHFIKHVLEAFTPEATRSFFEKIGVPLALEPTGKYFPESHSAKTVLDALVYQAHSLGVVFQTGIKITQVHKENDHFILTSGKQQFKVRRLVMATGGLSHPSTGSDGSGYAMVQNLGHHLTETAAGLTPLLTDDPDWRALSGLAFDVTLSYYQEGKKQAERSGAFLFTHFGFSGPAALDISRYWALGSGEKRIEVDFLPGSDDVKQLPKRFVKSFLDKIKYDGKTKYLARMLHHYPLEVTGVFGYQKAEVTAGGVDLKEVKDATMESKLVPGLYLIGEILDVDGRIGGFNFQWAWSTGKIAGEAAVKSLK